MRCRAAKSSPCGRPGFTLVEFVVAAGMVFLAFVAAMDISWRAWVLAAEMHRNTKAINALRAAAAWVSHDLHRASGVTAAGPGLLQITTADGTAVAYRLTGDGLIRDDGSAARMVAARITGADFSVAAVPGGSLVTAEFTAAGGGKVRVCVYVCGNGR
ncbi:MAG: hypothetical protein ACPLSY_04870 [Moorellaceae bacterium]